MSNPSMSKLEKIAPAIEQLTNYQKQLDFDGVRVGVSRQALDEVLAYLASLQPAEAAAGGALSRIATDIVEQLRPAIDKYLETLEPGYEKAVDQIMRDERIGILRCLEAVAFHLSPAPSRDAGLEEAAKWHDNQADKLAVEASEAEAQGYYEIEDLIDKKEARHRFYAEKIRALKQSPAQEQDGLRARHAHHIAATIRTLPLKEEA